MTWWRSPFRMVQTNLRLVDADLDADKVASFVAGHGANAWLVNTGGIYANHPSALDCQTPNPELAARPGGDLVADAVAAARAHGLHYLARMDFSKVLPEHAEAHPEWLYLSAAGERQVFNGLTTTCPSAGYFQEALFDVLGEVLDTYPVEGFFLNWFMYSEQDYAHRYHGPCHCAACAERFPADTGLALPATREDPAYPAWTRWSRGMLLELGTRIQEFVEARKPGTPLILHDTAHIRYVEANNAIGREPWHHQTAESVSAALTALPDSPVVVNCAEFLDFPYRVAGEEPERYAQYLVQAFSRGAAFSTYMMGYPGRIPYPATEVAGELTRFHRDHAELYEGLRQESAVLLASSSADLTPHSQGATHPEFRGMYSALLESHVPFDVVLARQLTRLGDRLHRYRALVLPGVGALDAETAALVDRFVERGGVLLATGGSGFDGDTVQLASLGLASAGAVRSGSELLSVHVQVDEQTVLPVLGTLRAPVPTEGTEVPWPVLAQGRFGPPEYCYGQDPTDEPGLLVSRYGAGVAATVPWDIGAGYRQLGARVFRTALGGLLEQLAPGTALATDLPPQVEIVLGRGAAGRLVHLVSHVHSTPTGYAEPVGVRGRVLRVPGAAGATVRALVAGTEPATRTEGDDLVVELPEIHRFEVLAVGAQPDHE